MLDFGKTNLFLNDRAATVVSRIITYYDLMGYNCLFLDRRDSEMNTKCSRISYTGYDSIPSILQNNLFNVNIIIIQIGNNYKYVLKLIREITDLPVILIEDFNQREFTFVDFDNIYRFYRKERDFKYPASTDEMERIFLESSSIEDVKNNWDMSLFDLRIQYIRDEKINNLLK